MDASAAFIASYLAQIASAAQQAGLTSADIEGVMIAVASRSSRHLIKSDELATADPAQVIKAAVLHALANGRPDHIEPS